MNYRMILPGGERDPGVSQTHVPSTRGQSEHLRPKALSHLLTHLLLMTVGLIIPILAVTEAQRCEVTVSLSP